MADLANTLKYLALSTAFLHPEGHQQAGEDVRLQRPVDIDYKNLTESWPASSNKKAETIVQGGGFTSVDAMVEALKKSNPKEGRNFEIANSVQKLAYPFVVEALGGRFKYPQGDIGAMKALSGNPHVDKMLIASALAGFIPNKDWSLNFQTPGGVPSLMFSMPTDFLGK